MLLALTAAVIFAQAAPDAAQPPAALQAPAPAEAAASNGRTVSPLTVAPLPKPKVEVARDTVVCRTEPTLGSLFPKKVCMTKGQMDERRRVDQENVREWTRPPPLAN